MKSLSDAQDEFEEVEVELVNVLLSCLPLKYACAAVNIAIERFQEPTKNGL